MLASEAGEGVGGAIAAGLSRAETERAAALAPEKPSVRLRAFSSMRVRLASSSYEQSVANSSDIATRETRKVNAIFGGRLEELPSTRGCR